MNKTTEALMLAEEALAKLDKAAFDVVTAQNQTEAGIAVRVLNTELQGSHKALAAIREALAEQPTVLEDPHPPHRLCECTACLEYWTPLPDCDAFAASVKPIAEQEPVGEVVSYHQAGLYDELPIGTKLYASPVRTKDLTDDEIGEIYEKHHALGGCWTDGFAYERAVIAADREKNK